MADELYRENPPKIHCTRTHTHTIFYSNQTVRAQNLRVRACERCSPCRPPPIPWCPNTWAWMGHLRGTGDSLGLEQRKRLDGGRLYNARIQKGNTFSKSMRKKRMMVLNSACHCGSLPPLHTKRSLWHLSPLDNPKLPLFSSKSQQNTLHLNPERESGDSTTDDCCVPTYFWEGVDKTNYLCWAWTCRVTFNTTVKSLWAKVNNLSLDRNFFYPQSLNLKKKSQQTKTQPRY